MPRPSRPSPLFWPLLVLSAFLLFFRLGSYGLVETSDARYAEISWEMAASGDYLTPHLNYIKHFHKPPLTYWLTAAGYGLLGHNEWGARASLGLIGLATLLLTYGLGRRLFGERAGLAAWLVLLGMGGFLGAHRLLTTDPLLTLVMTASLYCLWRWQEEERKLWSHAFFACLGLVMMVKGPVGLAVIGLVAVAWGLAAGRLRRLGHLRWGPGLALFALIGLPWYLWMVLQNPGLLHYFLFGQLAERVSGEMGHPHPFWYTAAMFALFCLPWTPFLPAALGRGPRPRQDFDPEARAGGARAFLTAWVLVTVVFFSLPATKLPNYILPALPAAAILLGAWWARMKRLSLAGRLTSGLLAVALVVYPALLALTPGLTPGLEPLAGAIIWVGGAAALALVLAALTARPWPAFAAQAVLLPALLLAAGLRVEAVPFKTYRPLGVRAAELAAADPAARVASYRCRVYSLPFYTQRRVIEAGGLRETQFEQEDAGPLLPNTAEFLAAWERGGRIYCLLPRTSLPDFNGRSYRLLAEHRQLVLISNEGERK